MPIDGDEALSASPIKLITSTAKLRVPTPAVGST